MEEDKSTHQDLADTAVSPLKGLMIMAGSVLFIIAAVATPILGEALFAGLLYGKPIRDTFKKKS